MSIFIVIKIYLNSIVTFKSHLFTNVKTKRKIYSYGIYSLFHKLLFYEFGAMERHSYESKV